jgi:holliday junction DNA helicase RuvA
MYEHIKGTLVKTTPLYAVLEAHGVGYKIWVPVNNSLNEIGKETLLYTYLVVKEDSHSLYGFEKEEQRELFEQFLSISGIGPKTALLLVGHLDPAHFFHAIAQGDVRLLCKVPGIGKKTAERLIVEMKDKCKGFSTAVFSLNKKDPSAINDAVSALIHLGYTPIRAQQSIKSALDKAGKELNASELITQALKEGYVS